MILDKEGYSGKGEWIDCTHYSSYGTCQYMVVNGIVYIKVSATSVPSAWEHAIGIIPVEVRPSFGVVTNVYTMNIWIQQGSGYVYHMGSSPQTGLISYPLGS